jgi:hypothetical protein
MRRVDPIHVEVDGPSWYPGVIQVEFREAPPEWLEGLSRAETAYRTEIVPAPLGGVLHKYGFQSAEYPFRDSRYAFKSRHKIWLLHFDPQIDLRQVASELRAMPVVKKALPLPAVRPPRGPLDDPLVGSGDQLSEDAATTLERQWYLFRCGIPQVWVSGGFSGTGVVIADIDWGFSTTHQELAAIEPGNAFNAYDGTNVVNVGGAICHGTGAAALAVARPDGDGMVGVAFGAALWPIQANIGNNAAVPGDPWAAAVDWVRSRDSDCRRKIIMLEVETINGGNIEQVMAVNTAIRDAIDAGMIVCVAAGNGATAEGRGNAGLDDGGNSIDESGAIVVGATAFDSAVNRRLAVSNWGERVTVCAPGDPHHDVTASPAARDAYVNEFGGTSGALPKIAGTIALMLEKNSTLCQSEVRQILIQTGSIVESGHPVGPFVDAAKAVDATPLP